MSNMMLFPFRGSALRIFSSCNIRLRLERWRPRDVAAGYVVKRTYQIRRQPVPHLLRRIVALAKYGRKLFGDFSLRRLIVVNGLIDIDRNLRRRKPGFLPSA